MSYHVKINSQRGQIDADSEAIIRQGKELTVTIYKLGRPWNANVCAEGEVRIDQMLFSES